MPKAKHNPPMVAKKGQPWPWHRPAAIDENVLRKLAEGFASAMNDVEACLFADIAPSTLYEYANKHPGFSEWKEDLKKKPGLKAKLNRVKAIAEGDQAASAWWLERKNSDEFAQKQKNENDNKNSGDIGLVVKFQE